MLTLKDDEHFIWTIAYKPFLWPYEGHDWMTTPWTGLLHWLFLILLNSGLVSFLRNELCTAFALVYPKITVRTGRVASGPAACIHEFVDPCDWEKVCLDLSGCLYSTSQLDLVNQNSLTDYLQNGNLLQGVLPQTYLFCRLTWRGLIIGMAFPLSHL